MNNKQRYQRAFSPLRASDDFLTEVRIMKQNHDTLRRGLTLCAAVIAVLAMATVCYATDVGGIRQLVRVWILGEEKSATLEIRDGHYTLTDGKGDTILSGGGTAIGFDGTERPLNEEEILEHLDSPEVRYYDDDTVLLYYHDQQIDITDQFDEDGVCYLKVGKLYFTIKYQNGFGTSPDDYPAPDSFNTVPPQGETYVFPATEK